MTLLSAGITTGETLTVIDQFNLLADYDHQQDADGDVIQTTDTTHTADLPSWVDDNVFEATSPGYTEYLDTGAGSIDAYPSKGDANPSMYFLSSTTSGADYGVMYNVVDGNTFYEIHLDGGAQEVQFSKRDDDGTYSEFQSWSATISGGELYEIEFQHGDGTNGLADEEHLVRVTNVSDGTTLVDTTYTIAAGNELTVSDGFGVKFNGSGTMRAHGAAVNGDTDTSNGGGGSNGTYYTGDILYTSDYSGIQATIDAASATDTVRVDTVETVSEVVSVKSGIKVEGDGGKIQAADGSGTDILRPSEASNIWFDGLHIDGGWEGPNGDGGNVGTRCIGGVNVGPVDHIRITNCTIENSGLNAINFVDKESNDISDIYIAGNTITDSRNHGILMGMRQESGTDGIIENILIEDNDVTLAFDAQPIGVFGQDGSVCRKAAIINNRIDQQGGSYEVDPSGANAALEEDVRNSIMAYNSIQDDPNASRGGPNRTKEGTDCIIANNEVFDHGRSINIDTQNTTDHSGPDNTVVVENYVNNGGDGVRYADLGDKHLTIVRNRIENTSTIINDGGGNNSTNKTIDNNGPSIPDESSTGIPSTIPTSDSWSYGGETIGSATWDSGGVDPTDSVQVDVTVGGSGTYYTGDTLYTSDYSGPQAAIDAASATDTVVFDQTESVAEATPASITVAKSDIKIEGDPNVSGDHLRPDNSNPTGDLLRIEEPATNIWVDGLVVDCDCEFQEGGGGAGAARGIGGKDVGALNHIRITNCTVKNVGRNGINFVNGSQTNSYPGDLTDFYIANNSILTSDGHGILMGVYDEPSNPLIKNVIYEDNYVEQTNAQGCGLFASEADCTAENVLFIDNEISQPSASADQMANMSFEADVNYALAYGNYVDCDETGVQGGPSATKGGVDNIFARNYVQDAGRSIRVMDRDAGVGNPPRNNLVHANDTRDANHCVYTEELDDGGGNYADNGLQISDNLFDNCGGITQKNNTGNYDIFNNGISPGNATGVPATFENPVSFTDSNGDTVGAASWNIGGPDPANPVEVRVDVSLNGGASVPDVS